MRRGRPQRSPRWPRRALTALVMCVLAGLAALVAQPRTPPASAAREDAYRANNLGVAYLEQYNHQLAAQSFRRALEIDGSLTLARINLAIALLYVPDLPGAEREARAALQQQPEAPQAHYVLGLVARTENRPDDGIAAFKRVLAIDPRDVGALVNLGQLLMQRREYAEAAALFRTAVDAEPYHVTATYNLAVALTRSSKTAEGQQMTAQFQKLRESGYGTTFSNNYLEQGRYAEALVSTGAEPELVRTETPDVRFVSTRTIAPPPPFDRAQVRDPRVIVAATGLSGGVTLVDLDRDDDLDVIDVATGVLRVFTNERGQLTDVTTKLGLPAPALPTAWGANATAARPANAAGRAAAPAGVALAAIAADYDNDERPDIFVLGVGSHALYRQMADGRFEDRTAAARFPPADVLRRAGAFVDVDHDGDLDLFLAGTLRFSREDVLAVLDEKVRPTDQPPAPNQLLRNNGDGTFTDVTADAKVAGPPMQGAAIAATDYDNRRDLDLVVAGIGHAPVLFRNMRDGTFQDAAADTGLAAAAASRAQDAAAAGAAGAAPDNATRSGAAPAGQVASAQFQVMSIAAGDVDKDGFTDLFLGRLGGPGILLLNDRGTFRAAENGPAPANALASQFLDYDNDGLLDLVTLAQRRVSVWRNLGRAWADVTSTAIADLNAPPSPAAPADQPPQRLIGFAAGDLDRDGDLDLVIKGRNGELIVVDNRGASRQASMRVRLTGRASNRSGIGAKVEMRAGSLWQKLELSSTTPSTAPADLLFGLGGRRIADVVRVLWPAGIVQAEPIAEGRAQVVALTELDRKPSSCPYLYTWNGERFEFVTDFMGGGEMGYWHAPGVRNVPDPVEYVRIRGDQLQPRDGRYELRVTNELEEALFVDRLRLIAIAHPADVEVHPREGLFGPPFPPFELYAARDVRPAARVIDHAGRDVTDRARDRDRQFVDRLPLQRIRGYAQPHALVIDMTPPAGSSAGAAPDLLLLTGWTDYAFSSDNVAASQAGLSLVPPSLAVRNAHGQWQTVIPEIGIPVGRPQTVVVDLAGKWRSASREVQINTNMRIYWDRIQVGTRVRTTSRTNARATADATRVTLDPVRADLRWRGFSAEATADEPFTYDYARVSTTSPWKQMPGRYTREGDVRELLRATDDMFVVSRPGDEIAVSFDATKLPPLPTGWTRTFLLHSDGYSKEMDLNSASPDQAWPLPFHSMTTYPYAAPEAYPLTAARRAYIDRYNTRIVSRPLTPIDLGPRGTTPTTAAR